MNETPRSPSAPSLVSLDILRACAACLVVLEHTRGAAFVAFGDLPPDQHTMLVRAMYLAARLGQEAVVLFFVLSGFLVGGQIIRRARTNRFDSHDYAIDRATRILLPLIPAAIFAGIVGVVRQMAPFDPLQIAGNALGLNGILVKTLPTDVPLWSLAYEIWFYVIAGVAAVLCAKRGGILPLALGLAAMLAFCRLDASLLLVWVLGALASSVEIPRGRGLLALAGLIVLIAGSAAIQLARPSLAVAGTGTFPTAVARGVFAAGILLAIPWLTSPALNGALARHTGLARAAAFLAGMSYTLYLFHYPLLNLLALWFTPRALSGGAFAALAGVLTIVFVFALAMYWLFERNTDALRRRIKRMIAR